MTPVLELRGVWKRYRDRTRGRRTVRRPHSLSRRAYRWALQDVSLTLAAGEALGLVGHNGAGKSTLLRLASGLGRATRGDVAVDPRTQSVLNLGTTFDHELSGRENAYTSMLIAGLDPRPAGAKVEEVLDFAELGDFADAPVRTYSDGMRLRLAFGAVAVSDPKLLLLDEVLAVGDLAFRRRCEDRIGQLREGGTSLLLVSHSLEEIGATCGRTAWLHRGELRAVGATGEVLEAYRGAMERRTQERTPAGEDVHGSQEVRVTEVVVAGPGGDAATVPGGPLTVRLRLAAERPIDEPIVVVSLRRRQDEVLVLDLSTRAAGTRLGRGLTEAEVVLRIDALAVPGGEYLVDVGVFETDWEYAYDFQKGRSILRVDGPVAGAGVLLPPHTWTVER